MPSQIDRYVVERELGKGAFGTVYRARHAVTGRPVALKVLHARHASDVEMVERFFREARAAASTMSPNIVDVLDASIAADGSPFLALELLEGEDLEAYVTGRDRLAVLDAAEIGRDVAQGVADAHKRGIVHRDLKPANVFLARQPDGTRRAKVLDFGMSKLNDRFLEGSARTATGAIMGTPLYMAPEQLQGGARGVDAAADVYALGAILFRMVTGRPTHDARTIEELLVRRITEPPPSASTFAPGLPSTLVHLIARCLEVDPARRTVTASEIARELGEMTRLLRGQSLSSSGLSSSTPPAAPLIASTPIFTTPAQPSRWPRILAGIALTILGLACVAGMLVVASMGGLAWLLGDIASSLMEDAESLREATSVPATPIPSLPLEPPPEPPLEPPPEPPPTAPTPAPTGAASNGVGEGVTISASVLGRDATLERAIAASARPALVACRGDRDETFTLEFTWMGWGGAGLGVGTSTLMPRGRPPATAAETCAQQAILAVAGDQRTGGLVTFRISLRAR